MPDPLLMLAAIREAIDLYDQSYGTGMASYYIEEIREILEEVDDQ